MCLICLNSLFPLEIRDLNTKCQDQQTNPYSALYVKKERKGKDLCFVKSAVKREYLSRLMHLESQRTIKKDGLIQECLKEVVDYPGKSGKID